MTTENHAYRCLLVDRNELRNAMAKAGDMLAQAQTERDDLRAHAAKVEDQRDTWDQIAQQHARERDEARAEVADLKETVRMHRAVRELVKTENARRSFSNARRADMFPGRKAMPLIDF